MTCIVNPTIEQKKDAHNLINKIKKGLRKDAIKDNPKASAENIEDRVLLYMEDKEIPTESPLSTQAYTLYRKNIKAGNESSVDAYAIEKFKGGYKILYVTPKTNEAKVVRVASNGRTVNAQYDIDNLKGTYDKLNKEPAFYGQQHFTFNAEEDTQIEIDKENTELIEAHLINDSSKSKDVFDMLVQIDNVELSKEAKDLLVTSLAELTDMSKKVIPDMIQTININATKNYGATIIEGEDTGVYIGVSKGAQIAGNAMSAPEMYVHEMSHAALEYAQKFNRQAIAKTMADIEKIYKKFLDTVTVEDFMPEISPNMDRKAERVIAEARIEYLRNSKTGINEFIVMAKTNLVVKKVLEERVNVDSTRPEVEGLFNNLIRLIEIIYDNVYLFTRKNVKHDTGFGAMNKYIHELSAANNMALNQIKKKNGIVEMTSKVFDKLNELTKDGITKLVEKYKNLTGINTGDNFLKELLDYRDNKENYTKLEKAKLLIKIFSKFILDGSMSHVGAFETWLELMGLKPEGTIQQLIRRFRQSDDFETLIEAVGLQKHKTEADIEEAKTNQSEIIRALFENELTEMQTESLTKTTLDIELGSLIDENLNESTAKQVKIMKKVLGKEEDLELEIADTETQIRGAFPKGTESDFIINQTEGLGDFMVTQNANEGQLVNAYMILGMSNGTINKYTIAERNNDMAPHRALIDKLATLHGIKNTDINVRQATLDLLNTEESAVLALLDYNKVVEEQVKKSAKSLIDYEIDREKGFHDKIGADWLSYRVAYKSDSKRLEADNYTVSEKGTFDNEFEFYINGGINEPGWVSEGMNITNDGQHINSYINIEKEHILEKSTKDFTIEDIAKVEKIIKAKMKVKSLSVFAAIDKSRNKNNKVGKKTGSRPVFATGMNGELYVTDMDISVDKRIFENQMHKNNDVDAVLAKTYSRALSLEYARKNNMLLLELLEKDSNENYKEDSRHQGLGDKNLMSYIKIGPNEDNELSKEIWGVIPRYMKTEIIRKHYLNKNRELAVIAKREGMYNDTEINTDKVAEYEKALIDINKETDATVEDILAAHENLNNELKTNLNAYVEANKTKKELIELQKEILKIEKSEPYIAVRRNLVYHIFGNREFTLLDYSDNKMKNKVVTVAKYIDMLIKYLAKITKTNIVLRDLPVLMGNIRSNILLSVLQGNSPVNEIKRQFAGVQQIHKYKTDKIRAGKLSIKIASKNYTTSEKNEYDRLIQQIRNNPAKPLVDAGLAPISGEDLINEKLHQEEYFENVANKYLNKLPKGVLKVLEFLYITKHTKVFKLLLLAMQYSDFAARYSKYYQLIEQGFSHKEAIKMVTDNQINYGWGHGKTLQWANERFYTAFTKFFEGIQKVVKETAKDKPFNVGLAVGLGGMIYTDSPLQDTVFGRDLTNMFYGGPYGIAKVLTEMPAAIQIATGKYN